MRDKIAQNEEEIVAQKTIADGIVKELSGDVLLDVEHMNRKVAELDSSFNAMVDLKDINRSLQHDMAASLRGYEQRLRASYGTLNRLRDTYGDYFMAFPP